MKVRLVSRITWLNTTPVSEKAGCYSCLLSLSDYSGLVSPPGTPSRRSPTLHIPTDNKLSSPIRHYISESLICQVLGQPSFSLTCLLVSSVVEYMGITVSLHRPITIEDICKMVRPSYCILKNHF